MQQLGYQNPVFVAYAVAAAITVKSRDTPSW